MFNEIDPQIILSHEAKVRVPETEGERWLDMLGYFPIADIEATKVVKGVEMTVRAGDFDQICGDHVRGRFTKFGLQHRAYIEHGVKVPDYDKNLAALRAPVIEHFPEGFDEAGQMIIPGK